MTWSSTSLRRSLGDIDPSFPQGLGVVFLRESRSFLTLRTSAVIRFQCVNLQARVEVCKRPLSISGRGRWPWRTTAVGLSLASLQFSRLNVLFFQGVSKERSVDTAGHGRPSCNSEGSEASNPPFVSVGARCLLDKGANPRTGGQRTKDRRPPLLLTLTLTCPSYAVAAVPYMLSEPFGVDGHIDWLVGLGVVFWARAGLQFNGIRSTCPPTLQGLQRAGSSSLSQSRWVRGVTQLDDSTRETSTADSPSSPHQGFNFQVRERCRKVITVPAAFQSKQLNTKLEGYVL